MDTTPSHQETRPATLGGGFPNGVVARSSVVEQVTSLLREAILSGRIPPGTRLRQDKLAADFQVSRTPVREAFRSLSTEGLLDVGSGTADVVSLSTQDARDYYEIREFVDGLAARLAASRRTETDLDILRQHADAMIAATDPLDAGAWLAAHTAFHLAILKASGNSRMDQLEMIVRISAQMLFPRLKTKQQRMHASADEHLAIVQAIADGDADLAEQVARHHIRSARSNWVGEDESVVAD